MNFKDKANISEHIKHIFETDELSEKATVRKFRTENGKVNIDVFFHDETLWLTQKLISELFEKGRSTITGHLNRIFSDGKLDEKQVCKDFLHTTKHDVIKDKM